MIHLFLAGILLALAIAVLHNPRDKIEKIIAWFALISLTGVIWLLAVYGFWLFIETVLRRILL